MKVNQLLTITFLIVFSQILSAQKPILAGASMVNITPPIGTIINGDFLPMHAKTIHDPLHAKALAFSDGNKKFVFVVVDCMAIDGDLIDDTKKLIQNQLGLSPNQIMISSTHAHSCGAVRGGSIVSADLPYRLSMPAKILNSVKLALKNMEPVKIGWGSFELPKYISCRRWYMKPGFSTKNPFGEIDKVWMNPPPGSPYLDKPVSVGDPEVSFLAVKNMKNEVISILANYSIHYAADIPENTISADYFGEVHKQLKEKLGANSNFVGIMSNGTSGDINTTDFRQERDYPKEPYGKSKLIANDISDAIIENLKTINFETKPLFSYSFNSVLTKTRKPSPELIARSKKTISELDFSTLKSIDKASDNMAKMFALEIIELDAYQKDEYSLPIQAIRIGEGAIGTLPGEIFAETGLKLKKNAPTKNYFTVCLANFGDGYIPPASQMALGGYETWLNSGTQMEIGAEEKLFNNLSLLVRNLFK